MRRFVRPTLWSILAITLGLAVAVALSQLFPQGPILDISPLENFVVVRVEDDTPEPVEATICYSRACRIHDVSDGISPYGHRDEAINNGQSGLAVFRVKKASGQVRCLRLRYAAGQRHASLRVSAARPCPWPRSS
jgi:hypothetical protein